MKSRQTVSKFLGETHQAKQGTPTMGGLIIVFGATAGMLATNTDWHLIALFLGFAFIGFADDYIVPKLMPGKRGLGWIPKLAMQIGVCLACLLTVPESTPLEVGVTTFLVLFMANAYNFADGLDGLAGSLFIVLAFGILILHPSAAEGIALPFALLAIVGGTIPFLFLNAPPARVFMGDVGSLAIGSILGVSASFLVFTAGDSTCPTGFYIAVGVLFFVMIAELVPVPLQILSVKLRKGKRLFPRTPIHHTFEVYKWPESRITWSFVLVQIVCALTAYGIVEMASTGVRK